MKDDVPPELAEVFGEEAKEHLETIARLTTRLSSGRRIANRFRNFAEPFTL
jgi:hypothetical protein